MRVVLRAGDQDFECLARIDTGAAACLFQREVGESLGLDIEAGLPERFSTLTGPLPAFGHEVTMQVAGLTYQTTVYFAKFYNLPRNLLGKLGWLQQIRFGLRFESQQLNDAARLTDLDVEIIRRLRINLGDEIEQPGS
jgi:hypothetical protein